MKVELATGMAPLRTLDVGDTFLLDGLAYCVCYPGRDDPGDYQKCFQYDPGDYRKCFRFDGALLIPINRERMVEPRPMKVVDDMDGKETTP